MVNNSNYRILLHRTDTRGDEITLHHTHHDTRTQAETVAETLLGGSVHSYTIVSDRAR